MLENYPKQYRLCKTMISEKVVSIQWPTVAKYGTTDPDIAIRPWLEKNIGEKSRDWDWFVLGKNTQHWSSLPARLIVYFRKEKDACFFILTFK